MRVSKVGLGVAAGYLLLVAASILYVVYRARYAPAGGEFAALGVALLTLPWFFLVRVPPESYGAWLGFGLINAALIYLLVMTLDRLADRAPRRRR